MLYRIDPIAKPRMVQSDVWKKRPCVLRYWDYKERVRELGIKFDNGQKVTFFIPMPKSWPKYKKRDMAGKPHKQTPDIDNLLKSLLDCLFDDDCHIWHVAGLKKVWSDQGGIEIQQC